MKNVTIRLPEDEYFLVENVAMVNQTTITGLIREALESHLSQMSSDKRFRAEVQSRSNQLEGALDALAKANRSS